MKFTKDDVSSFFTKVGKGLKTAATKTAEATKTAYNKTKERVNSSIEKNKREKEIKHNNEVSEYQNIIFEKISEIEDQDIIVFLSNLDKSPTELTKKTAKKIKESFPILREQTVLWSLYLVETNRTGGIVVTEKGIYIKTLVNVYDEKAFKKENRKVSQLYYYPWEMIDMDVFLSSQNEEVLNSFGKDKTESFVKACSVLRDTNHQRQVKLANRYSYYDQVLSGDTVVVSSALNQADVLFARNNGQGNNPNGGFGLFAEQANNMSDRIHLKNARVVGGDNAKNGPDRLVNGVNIQTKYYKTGARSVGATFDNKGTGNYRYWNNDGTPMKLEVPKGQRAKAVETMRNKILEGKVRTEIDGKEYVVKDPAEAENIIVEGHYTIEQAKNIAKAGTIDSLVYDVEKASVSTACIFGISFLISSFLCYRKTHDPKESAISGLLAGGKAAALSLTTSVIITQLARTKAFSTIMTKSVIKSGVVGASVGFLVFSIPETYSVITKKISRAQYAANLAVLSASVIGGTAGAYAGAAIGTAAGTAAGMGAGSVPLAIAGGAGGVVGGAAVGTAAAVGTSKVIDIFFEGDEKRIARLFNAFTSLMAAEYLLDETEMDKLTNKLNTVSDRKMRKLFTDIHKASEQEPVIREFLGPYFDEIVREREKYEPKLELIESIV